MGGLGRGRTFGGEGALAFGCVEVEVEGVGGRGGGEVEEDIVVGVGGVVAGDAEEGHCCGGGETRCGRLLGSGAWRVGLRYCRVMGRDCGLGLWRCKRRGVGVARKGTFGGVKTLFAESGCAGSDPSIRVISGDV